MTSLDKALIKVYEHGHAPKERRPVDIAPEESARELYVDPPSDDLPSPTIAHQVTVEALRELIAPVEPETETETENEPPPIAPPSTETATFAMGDMTATLESFVVQQEFDIPVLEEIGTVVADLAADTHGEEESSDAQFSPAWEVDSFELPDAAARMSVELRQQLDDFTAYLRHKASDDKKLVTIHSQSRGEGRTTLSITLATTLAKTGARVLLVDSDFGNPALAHRLGLAVEIGWEKAIAGEVPIAECSVRSIGDAFTLLPLADTATDEDHAILRDALRNLLSKLVANFDLILVDTGPGQPILGEIFEDMIATCIAVRDVRRTDSRLMLQFMSSLRTNAEQSVDAVDNFA